MKQLRGIFAALATPFTEGGERVDEAALRQLVDHMIAHGIHGLVSTGGTGEGAALTAEERRTVLEIILDQNRGRLPVFAATSACATREVVALSRHAQQAGATGVMVLGPYYDQVNEEELYWHYATVATAIDLPMIVYNHPGSTGYSLRPEFLARLAHTIDNIVAIKDTTGEIDRLHYLMQLCGDKATVFNGADTLAFAGFAAGSVGAIWGAANAAPRQCVDLFEALVTNHDLIRGREIWRTFYPLNRFFEQEGYNAAVKAATNMQGINVGVPRPPVLPLSSEKAAELGKLLEAVGLRGTTTPVGS